MTRRSFRYCANSATVTVVVWFAVATSLSAQTVFDSTRTDTIPALEPPVDTIKADTILFVPPPASTTTEDVTNPVDLEKHLVQRPTAALFKSMLVPGLGQLGNHRYVKAALFAGLEGWLTWKMLHFNHLASDARKAYLGTVDYTERKALYYEYDGRRRSRNKYAWFTGLTIFVSMFDAYVDAHLSGSPADKRNEKIRFGVAPDNQGGAQALVSFRF